MEKKYIRCVETPDGLCSTIASSLSETLDTEVAVRDTGDADFILSTLRQTEHFVVLRLDERRGGTLVEGQEIEISVMDAEISPSIYPAIARGLMSARR